MKSRLVLLRSGSGILTAWALALSLAIVSALGVFSLASAGQAKSNTPQLVITPAEVEYRSKVTVVFSGSGFKPKQDLNIEVELGGAPSDVSWLMEPKPVPDANGAFSSKWVLDDEIRRKLFEPKTYTVEVVDADGKVLTQTPLVFKKAEGKAEKKK